MSNGLAQGPEAAFLKADARAHRLGYIPGEVTLYYTLPRGAAKALTRMLINRGHSQTEADSRSHLSATIGQAFHWMTWPSACAKPMDSPWGGPL